MHNPLFLLKREVEGVMCLLSKKQFSPKEIYYKYKITQIIEYTTIKTAIYFQLLSFSKDFAHQMLSKCNLWKISF